MQSTVRNFRSLSHQAVLTIAASLFLSLSALGQVSPTPTPRISEDTDVIKIETELVNINVRVVDRLSRPIGNLKRGEFKIYEDNVLQEIDFFSQSEVPTNYSMVIDNSGSLRSQIEKVIEASKILIGSNRPSDETSVIRFVGRDKIEILQDFTPNKDDLEYALENLHIDGGQTALRDAIYLASDRVTEYEKTANGDDGKRRALILITDGEDRQLLFRKPLFNSK